MQFATGYDHPDKYMRTVTADGIVRPLPKTDLVEDNGAELDSAVFLGRLSHYRVTNSTTMTFAARVSTLRAVAADMADFVDGTHPSDYHMFLALRVLNEMRVATVLPGCSTHGETAFLGPFTDWKSIMDPFLVPAPAAPLDSASESRANPVVPVATKEPKSAEAAPSPV